jgi:hypothetical protein
LANAETVFGHLSLVLPVDTRMGAYAVCAEGRLDALKAHFEVVSPIFDHLAVILKDFVTEYGVTPRGWLAGVPRGPRHATDMVMVPKPTIIVDLYNARLSMKLWMLPLIYSIFAQFHIPVLVFPLNASIASLNLRHT